MYGAADIEINPSERDYYRVDDSTQSWLFQCPRRISRVVADVYRTAYQKAKKGIKVHVEE